MESLVASVTQAAIVEEPFPHVVVREPLDPALCDRLIEEFPSVDLITEGRLDRSNELPLFPRLGNWTIRA